MCNRFRSFFCRVMKGGVALSVTGVQACPDSSAAGFNVFAEFIHIGLAGALAFPRNYLLILRETYNSGQEKARNDHAR